MNSVVFVVQKIAQALLRKTGGARLMGNFVSKVEKRLDSFASKPLIIRDGQHDGDITVLIADHDGRPLRLVEHGFKTNTRLRGANDFHVALSRGSTTFR